ncbi:MAG: hypothetical protein WBW03_10050 [Silvibacterium sp.]
MPQLKMLRQFPSPRRQRPGLLSAYGVGAALVATGLAMLANWRARVATTNLGIVVCVAVALVYLPILAAHPGVY